jgi:hypothetical protein
VGRRRQIEGIAYTTERLEAITQKAISNAKKGNKVSPDVTP